MAKKTKESKKIKGLVRIGVFSALWIAVSWAILGENGSETLG